MATLSVTIGAQSNSKTISNADITRLLDAAKQRYGVALSNSQAFDAVVSAFHDALRDMVKTAEANTAKAAIVDIAIT